MPTELLEHPSVVDDAAHVAPKAGSATLNPPKDEGRCEAERKPKSGKGVLRDIFEGHEEYLGWTPD